MGPAEELRLRSRVLDGWKGCRPGVRLKCWTGEDHRWRKPILMPQSMNIPDAKVAVDIESEKLENLPAWKIDKVKSKEKRDSGSTKREKESPLIDVHFSSKECWIKTKESIKSTKDESCSEVTL